MNDSITRHELPLAQRATHVEDLFGLHFPMQFEPFVFDTASRLSPDYHGGYWEFYELTNGGFYLAVADDATFRVHSPNGYEGALSSEAFGLVTCLFAYSHLSFVATKPAATVYAKQYHWLRDYVMEHAEVEAILRMTD